MSEQALKKAVALIRAGQKEAARQVLSGLLRQEPDNELAWLWISKCFDEPERKKYCFERALKANPENPIARKALKALQADSVPEQPLVKREEPQTKPQKKPLRRKRNNLLSYLLGLLAVVVIGAAVWMGLNYLLPKDIPITHAQLKSHLTAVNVFCSTVESTQRAASYAYVMRCNGYTANGSVQVMVDVYSEKDPQKIDLILAYVSQQNEQSGRVEMRQILSHVAALPYKNAAPAQASAWVERNFPLLFEVSTVEDLVTQFGRVRFHLASLTPTRKYLAIGEGSN